MDSENNANRGVSWALVLTAMICFAPVLYVISSGPMKLAFEILGKTSATHEQVYAPLVWLDQNTSANGAVDWYWGLFETDRARLNPNRGEYHDEFDSVGKEARGRAEDEQNPLGKWLYSHDAVGPNRSLGNDD